ncbi:MAG: T9SS type A sorting domain-containing protein [Ignavibacteria bacterium]|nr:T9SS type A sorting domain-containing protein [Ignavibacteria bacterium]
MLIRFSLYLTVLIILVNNLHSQWSQTGPYGGQVLSIGKTGNNIITATWTGINFSPDNGNNWYQTDLTGKNYSALSLLVFGDTSMAGMQQTGIYKSVNNGAAWQNILPGGDINCLTKNSFGIFAGTEANNGGVFFSTNGGINWVQTNLNNYPVISLISNNSAVVAGTVSSGIFISTNNGNNWINTLTNSGKVNSLEQGNRIIFAGTNGNGLYTSSNNGLNWNLPLLQGENILSIEAVNDYVYVGTAGSGMYYSTNNGTNFEHSLFPDEIYSLYASGNYLLAGTLYKGIYKTTNNGLNWSKLDFGNMKVVGLTAVNNTLFAGMYNNGIHYSTDQGINWAETNLQSEHINSIASNGSVLIAGAEASCTGTGVYRSTDNGINWHVPGFTYDVLVTCVAAAGTKLLVGTRTCFDFGGIYVSADNGNTFTNTLVDKDVISLMTNGNDVYAGMVVNFTNSDGGIFRSSNGGYNWEYIGLSGKSVNTIAVSGGYLFAGTGTGVYVSSNGGASWSQTSLNFTRVYTLVTSGNFIFAGTETKGVYISSNNGLTWIPKNQGWPDNNYISKLVVMNDNIYAGVYGGSVYKRALTEIVTVKQINTEIPFSFSLSQNYPNPFNPATKIKFSIPNSTPPAPLPRGTVSLKVYDITGKEVAVLVNEALQPGTYEVTFDGSGLTSGVYFYKLQAGNFAETKRMVLIK